MSKRFVKRWVAVAALASLPLTPGLTQDVSNALSPAEWAQLASMYGEPGSQGLAGTTVLSKLALEQIKCLCELLTAEPPSTEVPAIQNAPVTQNFIQLAQPEEPSTGSMNYAAPTYSAADLQGDIGDSEVSEDSE